MAGTFYVAFGKVGKLSLFVHKVCNISLILPQAAHLKLLCFLMFNWGIKNASKIHTYCTKISQKCGKGWLKFDRNTTQSKKFFKTQVGKTR